MQVPGTRVRRRRSIIRNPLPVFQPERWCNRNFFRNPKLPNRRDNRRRTLSVVLLVTGGVLCSSVAASYAAMYVKQRELLHEFKTHQPAGEALTKLSIPRIGLRAVVIEGASAHSLLMGPGHLTGSAIPGTNGNAVIAGHRDTFFRHVDQLRAGDAIFILRGGKQFRYIVVQKKIVQPNNLSVLRATKVGEITLITCYPTHFIGPAPQRLVIVARLAGS